ncbi:hypothetical protein BCR35DRAFT_303332 [Leucosporidium creatinivorum]|uniref:Uncharacterized protein n=1 Tax=Leucosporidium creatinivorum TaxID=106004 RepID=A0A1Y2FHQ7_9BASI|nr:hypothetical protein BCR35DRAFT_303332 [Leucosporidium creatinivorum]
MAAILSNDETRDFNRFLETFDASDSSEAAIVGGAELVIRRGQGWDGTAQGAAANSYSTAGNGYQRPTPAPAGSFAPPASAPLPYHHAPTPSSYAPPPQHIARPTYPISYATPPSHMGFAPPPPPPNPYPSAPLETLDQDRLERMAKQARELSDWVGANNDGGAPILHPHRSSLVRASSGERPEQGDEGRRTDGRSSLAPGGARHNGGRRGYSHERPPLMYPSGDGSSGSEDTMQRMREAEERLSFARRVKEANYESEDPRVHHQQGRVAQPSTTIIDYNSYNEPTPIQSSSTMAFVPPPPPRSRRARDPSPPLHHPQSQPQPELIITAPPSAPSIKRKAGSSATSTSKPKSAPRASTSTAPPPNDTEFDTDPALNPAPFPTPSNIPLSPFPPPPRAVRPRPSPSTSSTTASTSNSTPAPPTSGGKPALLSAEQKKANHIASEQKRRAAIRQGYEALCTVVPSLKAAVEEFEERVKKLGGTGGGGGGRAGKKRRGSGGAAMAGPLSGGIEVGGEKVDGRAGPKSEAVVLGKTVEHLRNLLSERQALLERLSSLYQLAEDSDLEVDGGRRMWEEHWDGGPVLTGNAAGDEAEDGDEEEEM